MRLVEPTTLSNVECLKLPYVGVTVDRLICLSFFEFSLQPSSTQFVFLLAHIAPLASPYSIKNALRSAPLLSAPLLSAPLGAQAFEFGFGTNHHYDPSSRSHKHRDIVLDVIELEGLDILASASIDRTIRLWDLTTGKHRRTLLGHAKGIRKVSERSERALRKTRDN